MILMPVAGWLMGRIAKAPFPVPAVLAAATLPYIFGTEFTIYGGNIASTLAGEFAFAWGLWFALVFFGIVMRGLQTGRYRAAGRGDLRLRVHVPHRPDDVRRRRSHRAPGHVRHPQP